MLSAPAFRVKLICPSGFILVSPEPATGQTACFVNHCLHAELLVLLLLLLLPAGPLHQLALEQVAT